MTLLALIRHAPTDWNETRRLQGRADPPLSPAGAAAVATWRIPSELAGFDWVSSPARRARETARLLVGADVPAIPDLIEMDWGGWEGRTLVELRATEAFVAAEDRGLDFHPPGGESPRLVQQRVRPWLAACAAAGRPVAAVTHKGVIRAVLGLATGWTFLGKPPWRSTGVPVHLLTLAPDGLPSIIRQDLVLRD